MLSCWLLASCTVLNAPNRDRLNKDGCTRQQVLIDEDWTVANLSPRWSFAPTEPPAWDPIIGIVDTGRVISGFDTPNEPHALVSRRCVPMASGNEINITLRAKGQFSCNNENICSEYAGIVLSRFTDMARDERLLDEISVLLHAGGYLQVTQNGSEVASASLQEDIDYQIRLQLAPALDQDNTGVLEATVRVSPNENETPILTDFRVADLDGMLTDGSDCAEVPGLRVAVEGKGNGVDVGPVGSTIPDCANPSQFESAGATLTSEDLGFNPSWTEGSIGAPALGSTPLDEENIVFELMVEGSNNPPDLEPITHIGYGIGHASTSVPNGASGWSDNPFDWLSSDETKLGDDPPSCLEMGCPMTTSVREPHLLFVGEERSRVVSYAREIDTMVARDVFALHFSSDVLAPDVPLAIDVPEVEPSDISGCVSLRDPSLIPVDSSSMPGYWALFTCEKSDGIPSEIQAVRLTASLKLATPIVHKRLLAANLLGAFAEAGVYGPEALVTFDPNGGFALRVWFMARALDGSVSVALAEGSSDPGDSLESGLPELNPFPANPLLSESSPILGSCDGECELKDLAVCRRADDFERIRFVLARSVNSITEGRFDELIPLEQFWRLP